MRNRTKNVLIAVGILLVMPSVALAYTGIPFSVACILHMVYGNAIIGFGEGQLVSHIFKSKSRESIAYMIVANYFSVLVCAALFYWWQGSVKGLSIHNCAHVLFAAGLGLYLIAILLEWPFCLYILRKNKYPYRVSFLASVITQTASCAVLGLIIILFIMQVHPTRDLSFAAESKATVYYIAEDKSSVFRVKLDGSGRNRVAILPDDSGVWIIETEPAKNGCCDLGAAELDDNGETVKCISLIKSIGHFQGHYETSECLVYYPWSLGSFDMRSVGPQVWTLHPKRCGADHAVGLYAKNHHTGVTLSIALAAPFFSWTPQSVTILPKDLVLYQLGEQIVVVDLNRRKIGLLAMGHSPVAVLDNNNKRKIVEQN